MKAAALFSGGKDSAYAAWLAMGQGWEIAHLVTIRSGNPASYMFHHPNIQLTKLQAEAAGIPHKLVSSKGEKEAELSDLKLALSGLGVEAVVSGAIASSYQKERVDRICAELGLKSIAPLWGRKQEEIALEEAKAIESIIVSVSADGLDESWLGRRYDEECVRGLMELNKKTGISPVGEGGEFETFTLNAPFFRKKIRILKSQKVWRGASGMLEITGAELSPAG